MELRIHRFLPYTEAEGPGKRACLWVQGCSIQCKGCGVPWTWPVEGGTLTTVEFILNEIKKSKKKYEIEGVMFLWGEPFDQAEALAELSSKAKENGLSIMTFTGYTIDDLRETKKSGYDRLLESTDLLIDGPFMKENLDLGRPWIGSSNQRYHFLTDRYKELANQLHLIPNRLEVRLEASGIVTINGMAATETLKELSQGLNRLKKET